MMITSVTMRLTLTLAVAAACVLIRTGHAFTQSSTGIHTHISRSLTTTTTQLSATEPTKESMEQDIQDMRAQAKERLRVLTEQMEGFKHDDDKNDSRSDEQEIVEKIARQNEQVAAKNKGAAPAAASTSKATATLFSKATPPPTFPQRTSKSNSDQNKDLLDDTRWKIVFNIGRERGTWMTEKWGASGDRLLFQVVVDLTEEPLYERDEFFQGVAGQKKLEIVEAWVFSTGVGAASRGRQPVAVKSQGGYKVLPGKGPAGTDILRLYIELTDKVQSKADSDVYCPAGRVYGTCGYFATPGVLQDRSSGGGRDQPYSKDILMDEQRRLSRQYKQIEEEQEEDKRLVSWDQMKRMKKLMELRLQLDRVATELQRAREWEPEKSQLRMSQDGRVSLTKEGGVSCNVRKGLALEYHILGKMELASVKHEDDDDHDDADN
jgi:hypothetical protein